MMRNVRPQIRNKFITWTIYGDEVKNGYYYVLCRADACLRFQALSCASTSWPTAFTCLLSWPFPVEYAVDAEARQGMVLITIARRLASPSG